MCQTGTEMLECFDWLFWVLTLSPIRGEGPKSNPGVYFRPGCSLGWQIHVHWIIFSLQTPLYIVNAEYSASSLLSRNGIGGLQSRVFSVFSC